MTSEPLTTPGQAAGPASKAPVTPPLGRVTGLLEEAEATLARTAEAQAQLDEQAQPRSVRRPYVAPMPRTWWLRNREYRAYAIREFSSVVVGLWVFDLLVGLLAINMGPESWAWWVQWQAYPVSVVLTLVALAFSIVHATTWFALTPKVIRVRKGRKFLADSWMVGLNYLGLIVFAALMAWWLGGSS